MQLEKQIEFLKEIDKLNKELQRLRGKLSNEKFISNAPEDVVNKEKTKLADAESALGKLEQQQAAIAAL